MAAKAKYFTVLGYFEDNGQIWCEHVRVISQDDVLERAVKQLIDRDNAAENIVVVGVFRGRHYEISMLESEANGKDILAINGEEADVDNKQSPVQELLPTQGYDFQF